MTRIDQYTKIMHFKHNIARKYHWLITAGVKIRQCPLMTKNFQKYFTTSAATATNTTTSYL